MLSSGFARPGELGADVLQSCSGSNMVLADLQLTGRSLMAHNESAATALHYLVQTKHSLVLPVGVERSAHGCPNLKEHVTYVSSSLRVGQPKPTLAYGLASKSSRYSDSTRPRGRCPTVLQPCSGSYVMLEDV